MLRNLLLKGILIVFVLAVSNFSLAYENEINAISTQMAEKISTSGKKTIAVVDFTDIQGNITELGRFLAEEFSVAFAERQQGFKVIDRTHLKSIIREHKLSATGLIDPDTARKLGEIAGVEALITGSITPFGDSIRLTIKILDTQTAMIIGASKGDIARTKAIEELLARGIEVASASYAQPPTSTTSSFTGASSFTSTANSKKVGDFLFTIRRIRSLANGDVEVALNILNQSDNAIPIIRNDRATPTLSDEKGNVYRYKDGWTNAAELNDYFSGGYDKHAVKINAKSDFDCNFVFTPEDKDIKIGDIGTFFSFSFSYLFEPAKKSVESSMVSFYDIKREDKGKK